MKYCKSEQSYDLTNENNYLNNNQIIKQEFESNESMNYTSYSNNNDNFGEGFYFFLMF